jgi:hypothetical protein
MNVGYESLVNLYSIGVGTYKCSTQFFSQSLCGHIYVPISNHVLLLLCREEMPEKDYAAFLAKYESVRSELAHKASHLLVIGMKRQALPTTRLPEWEEICATAASVQASSHQDISRCFLIVV